MNRPLVSVVLAYAAGLLLAQFFQPGPAVLFTISFSFLALVLVCKKHRGLLLWPLLLFLGWTNFAARNAVTLPDDLRKVLSDEPVIVAVRGELAETPHLKIIEHDQEEVWRFVARVRVSEIEHAETFAPASGEILVTTPGIPPTNFFAGQRVEINGVISRPSSPLAEGLFDMKSYLAERGIYFQLKADSTNDWRILPPEISRPPLTDRFLDWSRQTLALGLPTEDEPLRLLWAMTLGWRTAFTGDIGDPFLRAGTMHMFAINGLTLLLSGQIVDIHWKTNDKSTHRQTFIRR